MSRPPVGWAALAMVLFAVGACSSASASACSSSTVRLKRPRGESNPGLRLDRAARLPLRHKGTWAVSPAPADPGDQIRRHVRPHRVTHRLAGGQMYA